MNAATDRARGALLGALAGDAAGAFPAAASGLTADDAGEVLAWLHDARAGGAVPLSMATRTESLRILVKQATSPRGGGPVQG